MGRFDALLNPPKRANEEKPQVPPALSQTNIKPQTHFEEKVISAERQSASSQLTTAGLKEEQREEKHQNTKALKQKTIKTLKHFSSYLRPESLIRLKIEAAKRGKHDYDILQEAVDLFFSHFDK